MSLDEIAYPEDLFPKIAIPDAERCPTCCHYKANQTVEICTPFTDTDSLYRSLPQETRELFDDWVDNWGLTCPFYHP